VNAKALENKKAIMRLHYGQGTRVKTSGFTGFFITKHQHFVHLHFGNISLVTFFIGVIAVN